MAKTPGMEELVIGIGADVSDLAKAMKKSQGYLNDIKKSVAGVNFEKMVSDTMKVKQGVKSLKTAVVNGFDAIDKKLTKVKKAITDGNKVLVDMAESAKLTAKAVQTLPFSKLLVQLEAINKNTRGTAAGFKTLTAAINTSGDSFRRHEFDLHRIIMRLDRMDAKLKGLNGQFVQHQKTIRTTGVEYRRLGRSMAVASRQQATASNQMAMGMGVISMAMLSTQRIGDAFKANFLTGLTMITAEIWILSMAARTAFRMLTAGPRAAIHAVDSYRKSVIQMQSLLANFRSPDSDFAQHFQQSRDYAKELVQELDLISAYTLGTSFDLQAITQEFLKQGVVLDVNNKKAKEAFANVANAIEIIAAGFQARELQVRQEARALASGHVDLRATLATELDARTGGRLKELIQEWKASGTFMTEIGKLLEGYAASVGDIRNTWESIRSLIQTMSTRILRFGSNEFFDTFIANMRKIADYLQQHEKMIATKIYAGWKTVLTILGTIKDAISGLKEPLLKFGELFLTIFKGWGHILVGWMPEAIMSIVDAMKLLYNIAVLTTSQFDLAKQAIDDITIGFNVAGRTKGIFQSLFDGNWKLERFREQFKRDIGTFFSGDTFKNTKDMWKQLGEIEKETLEIAKRLGIGGYGEMYDAVSGFGERVDQRLINFYKAIDEFKKMLNETDVEMPSVAGRFDRDEYLTLLERYLNGASTKTAQYYKREEGKLKEHHEKLKNMHGQFVKSQVASRLGGLSAASALIPGGEFLPDISQPTLEHGPRFRFKVKGFREWLNERNKVVKEFSSELDSFNKEVDAILKINQNELHRELEKTLSEPFKSITDRWGSSMQKSMSELNTFVKDLKANIADLHVLFPDKITAEDVNKLFGIIDAEKLKETRRIIEDEAQKLKDIRKQVDDFVTERTGSELSNKIKQEQKLYDAMAKELENYHQEGLIKTQEFLRRKEQLEQAHGKRLKEIKREYQNAIAEARIYNELFEIDLLESKRQISITGALKERIKLHEELLERQKESLAFENIEKDQASWQAQIDAINRTRDALVEFYQELEKREGSFFVGAYRAMQDYVRDTTTLWEAGYEIMTARLEGMQNTLSDVMFDALRKELKSAREYLMDFAATVTRVATDIAAQWIIVSFLEMLGVTTTTNTAANTLLASSSNKLVASYAVEGVAVQTLTGLYWALAWAKAAAGVSGGAGASAGGAGAGTSAVGAVVHNGGLIMHSGGSVPQRILRHNERRAILEVDEYVMPKNRVREIGVGTLERLRNGASIEDVANKTQLPGIAMSANQNNYSTNHQSEAPTVINHWNVSAIDSKSFKQFAQQNASIFAEASAKASANNHPLRRGK